MATALAKLRNRERFTGDTDFVFVDWKGKHQYHVAVRSRFYAALQRAELRRIRFHDLRHTFGTTMAAAGKDLVTIQNWLGHAHISTTMRYAHFRPSRQGAQEIGVAFSAASNVTAVAV